ALVVTHISEPRDIQPRRSSAVNILVFVSFYASPGTAAEMMIHGIVAKLPAAAAQAAFPHIGGRVKQHPGGIERRRADEHNLSVVFVRLVVFGIYNLYTGCLFSILI